MAPVSSPSGQTPAPAVVYPDCDGRPMSDNTKQFRWIQVLSANLSDLFRDRPDVFVAGDLLWYPVEGNNQERAAPDVMVVLGRPRGDRGSYKQWEERDVPVSVAFEIRSPGNTDEEMIAKCLFYEEHGVGEYYVYDPESNRLEVRVRGLGGFRVVRHVDGFASPLLGIRFEMTAPEMTVRRPDGKPFLRFEELSADRDLQTRRADDERRRRSRPARRRREAPRRRREAPRRRSRPARRRREAPRRRSHSACRRGETPRRRSHSACRRGETPRRRRETPRRAAGRAEPQGPPRSGQRRGGRRTRPPRRGLRLSGRGRNRPGRSAGAAVDVCGPAR